MNLGTLIAGWLGAVSVVGCFVPYKANAALQQRAAFDMQCPASEVRIVSLGGVTRGVAGCAQQATYVNRCENLDEVDEEDGPKKCPWILNTDSRKSKLARASAKRGEAALSTRSFKTPACFQQF